MLIILECHPSENFLAQVLLVLTFQHQAHNSWRLGMEDWNICPDTVCYSTVFYLVVGQDFFMMTFCHYVAPHFFFYLKILSENLHVLKIEGFRASPRLARERGAPMACLASSWSAPGACDFRNRCSSVKIEGPICRWALKGFFKLMQSSVYTVRRSFVKAGARMNWIMS